MKRLPLVEGVHLGSNILRVRAVAKRSLTQVDSGSRHRADYCFVRGPVFTFELSAFLCRFTTMPAAEGASRDVREGP